MSDDDDCLHEHIQVRAHTNRWGEEGKIPVAYTVDLTASCRLCKAEFYFIGVPVDTATFTKPGLSPNGKTLRVPMALDVEPPPSITTTVPPKGEQN